MNQMSRAVEREAILCKRTAKAANGSFFFEDGGIAFGEMKSGADTSKAAANNDDLFAAHDRMSTFMSRYAERHAAESVPPMVARAHSRLI